LEWLVEKSVYDVGSAVISSGMRMAKMFPMRQEFFLAIIKAMVLRPPLFFRIV
jgi:hypothetical protein